MLLGHQRGFTREQLAAVALEMIDRDGLEALTMQHLAIRAGIGTMTLYGYFAGKADLLEAVVDAAVQSAELPNAEGSSKARRQAVSAAAQLPIDAFPNLTATATEWTQAMSRDDEFQYGLDRILDGLQIRLGA